ncbi:D-glycero-beta-D-manno-heptose 1,7-bisphosphate 7-phosphatase [Burkholderia sp. Bp8998]|uniref:D-glycero-beta-D-manno-heptose 1,7-bisphosphate 7-phosphatase n=1 Tax=Burkholderia sp. Bp8998 TaxID=2184557 RepID=UPI000F5998EF|nr:D-glycero-beta-D-manno-heptose 1,7-bisphosphate 7-phosphatase [Burkholderia sp. Bp8998]RQS23225.1 D-glycero-beta-D-manno-heptose 1,7-bisphosphate 7-phosphatase [Burkholderia sp. Bp8998]
MKRKALFLDRDGVINVDYGYVHQKQDCVFVAGIFDLVRLANATGYQVVIVTNQAGIGRGYFSEAQFVAFMDWMRGAFEARGARIDRVYFCPHHPAAGVGAYKQACECRKPQPGMLHEARRDLDLSMAESIMVGDKPSDLEAAERAGVGRRFLFVGAHRVDHAAHEAEAGTIFCLSDVEAALEASGGRAGRV